MANSAEDERSNAKNLFTQSKWALINAITDNEGKRTVEKRFRDLTKEWLNVRHKHAFLSTVSNRKTLDSWINDLTVEYTHAEREKTKYMTKASRKLDEKLNENRVLKQRFEHPILDCNSPMDREIKKYRSARDIEEHTFIGLIEDLSELLHMDYNVDVLERVTKQHEKIQAQFEKWKLAQNNYMCRLNIIDSNVEFDWMKVIKTLYAQTNTRIAKYLEHEYTEEPVPRLLGDRFDRSWLDRNRLPLFSGDMQHYPRFKSYFNREVLPTCSDNVSAIDMLKCCLQGESRDLVEGDDNIDEMWSKLDKRYGLWGLVVEDFNRNVEDVATRKQKSSSSSKDKTGRAADSYGDVKQINKLKIRYPRLWMH